MRSLATILMFSLATASWPVSAADPNQLFSTILGEIGRQIERKQREKQFKNLRPLWDACASGDVAACDRAARFPGVDEEGRADIERMRQAAERHLAFARDFHACQRMDLAACEAALAYPPLTDTDRARLLDWKRVAQHHQDTLADFRRNQRSCYAGSIAACTAAIEARNLDEGAIPDLERQRARLQLADQQRQAEEQRRQAVLAEFRQNQRNCYAGSIPACRAAIANSHVAEDERRQLAAQRDRLQLADQQRQAAERQRQAAIREYVQLRTDCAGGKRSACSLASTHAQVRTSDLAFLKQRDRELAPFTERLASIFSGADLADIIDVGSNNGLLSALLGVFALFAAGLASVYVVRFRAPATQAERELPHLDPLSPAEQPAEPTTAANFSLTGHMPTDVRRALVAAST